MRGRRKLKQSQSNCCSPSEENEARDLQPLLPKRLVDSKLHPLDSVPEAPPRNGLRVPPASGANAKLACTDFSEPRKNDCNSIFVHQRQQPPPGKLPSDRDDRSRPQRRPGKEGLTGKKLFFPEGHQNCNNQSHRRSEALPDIQARRSNNRTSIPTNSQRGRSLLQQQQQTQQPLVQDPYSNSPSTNRGTQRSEMRARSRQLEKLNRLPEGFNRRSNNNRALNGLVVCPPYSNPSLRDFLKVRNKRLRSDTYSNNEQSTSIHFNTCYALIEEMFEKILVNFSKSSLTFLDVACAPGGFSQYLLDGAGGRFRVCEGFGVTLAPELGGFEVLVDRIPPRSQYHLCFYDLLSRQNPPSIAPVLVDLVVADAQYLPGKEFPRFPYRGSRFADITAAKTALLMNQFRLAYEALDEGGSLIFRFSAIPSLPGNLYRLLVLCLDLFASVQPFKSEYTHCVDTSFYILCKGYKRHKYLANDVCNHLTLSYKRLYAAYGLDQPTAPPFADLPAPPPPPSVLSVSPPLLHPRPPLSPFFGPQTGDWLLPFEAPTEFWPLPTELPAERRPALPPPRLSNDLLAMGGAFYGEGDAPRKVTFSEPELSREGAPVPRTPLRRPCPESISFLKDLPRRRLEPYVCESNEQKLKPAQANAPIPQTFTKAVSEGDESSTVNEHVWSTPPTLPSQGAISEVPSSSTTQSLPTPILRTLPLLQPFPRLDSLKSHMLCRALQKEECPRPENLAEDPGVGENVQQDVEKKEITPNSLENDSPNTSYSRRSRFSSQDTDYGNNFPVLIVPDLHSRTSCAVAWPSIHKSPPLPEPTERPLQPSGFAAPQLGGCRTPTEHSPRQHFPLRQLKVQSPIEEATLNIKEGNETKANTSVVQHFTATKNTEISDSIVPRDDDRFSSDTLLPKADLLELPTSSPADRLDQQQQQQVTVPSSASSSSQKSSSLATESGGGLSSSSQFEARVVIPQICGPVVLEGLYSQAQLNARTDCLVTVEKMFEYVWRWVAIAYVMIAVVSTSSIIGSQVPEQLGVVKRQNREYLMTMLRQRKHYLLGGMSSSSSFSFPLSCRRRGDLARGGGGEDP